MADDAELDLLNHRLQLQQVEAALELDKDNADLKTLKRDLEEVVKLSMELLGKSADTTEIKWCIGSQCMAMCSRDKLRDVKARTIEKKKQKKLKLQMKQEEIEHSCETEKNRWINFSKKMLRNKTKKSIFASPDAPDGRVGVGTCGIGGRPMTKFTMMSNILKKVN